MAAHPTTEKATGSHPTLSDKAIKEEERLHMNPTRSMEVDLADTNRDDAYQVHELHEHHFNESTGEFERRKVKVPVPGSIEVDPEDPDELF